MSSTMSSPLLTHSSRSLTSVQSFVIGDERLDTLSEVSILESGNQLVEYYRAEVKLHNEKLDNSESGQQLGGAQGGDQTGCLVIFGYTLGGHEIHKKAQMIF